MRPIRKISFLGILIVISWMLMVSEIWPLPSESLLRLGQGFAATTATQPEIGKPNVPNNSASTGVTQKDIDRQLDFVRPKIWIAWSIKLLLILAGLSAGVMAVLSFNGWIVMTLSTSIIYLIGYALRVEMLGRPIIDSYLSWANVVVNGVPLTGVIQFFVATLLLPVFHLWLVIYITNARTTGSGLSK